MTKNLENAEAATLFENELARRGIECRREAETSRYEIDCEGTTLHVSIDNLERGLEQEGDQDRVERFVDAIVAMTNPGDVAAVGEIYWALEPNDYQELADFRKPLSDKIDRVLVNYSPARNTISWLSPGHLATLQLTQEAAEQAANANLARTLDEAAWTVDDIDGVKLGYVGCELPFKTSLLLAPNLMQAVQDKIGWPLLAVAPDRDFLYVWPAEHRDFAGRVGRTVVKEYMEAPYPLSTEVYRIDDDGIVAIGAFPVPEQ
jgi:hypothetical protein